VVITISLVHQTYSSPSPASSPGLSGWWRHYTNGCFDTKQGWPHTVNRHKIQHMSLDSTDTDNSGQRPWGRIQQRDIRRNEEL